MFSGAAKAAAELYALAGDSKNLPSFRRLPKRLELIFLSICGATNVECSRLAPSNQTPILSFTIRTSPI